MGMTTTLLVHVDDKYYVDGTFLAEFDRIKAQLQDHGFGNS